MKKLTTTVFCLVLSLAVFSQSQTVEDFGKTANGYDLYLYQSVIRMMNKDKNPDFNMLIRNLDHLKFISTDSLGVASKAVFNKLDSGIRGEGFEEVITYDSRDGKCHLYELEMNGEESTWVATLLFSGYAGVMEMKGGLDINYLQALSSLNLTTLKELLPLEDFNQD